MPTFSFLMLSFFLPWLLLTPAVHAETPPAPPNWWLKSSLNPSASSPDLLHKFDLALSHTKLAGNTSGFVTTAAPALTLRYGRWTGLLADDYARKKYTQGSEQISSLNRTSKIEGQYDLCRHGYLGGGLIWEKDSNNDIELRRIAILGLGSYLLDAEEASLGLFLGGGQADEDYDAVVERYTALDHRTYNILYLYQTLDWQLTDWLLLSEGVRLIRSFSEMNEFALQSSTSSAVVSGKKERSLFKGKAELRVPLRQYFNIFLAYQLNHDSHAWPGNKTTDSMTTLGIRFSR